MKDQNNRSIPLDWNFKKIMEIGQVITGKTPSTKNEEYWNGKIAFITPPDLDGSLITNVSRFITDEGLKSAKPLPRGSVLVSCIGYIGKVGITSDEISVTNQQINAVIPNKESNCWFLAYLFQHLQSKLNEAASITTVPILNKSNFENLEIPLPPLPEQRAIAHVLRTVQQAKESTEKVIAAAKELKKSLMKHLFTYGAVPFDQVDLVKLKETEIGFVPEEWEIVKFGSVVEIKRGQVDPTIEPYLSMFHVGPENVEEATGRLVNPQVAYELGLVSGKYLFDSQYVVYSKIRPYLRKAVLPTFEGICSADMYPMKPNAQTMCLNFLFYWLLSDPFTRQAISYQSRTGIPKVNRQQLNSTLMPLPPNEEQLKLAMMLGIISQKIEVELNRLTAMEILFDSLLHHLMTGKVRVNDLDFGLAEEGE